MLIDWFTVGAQALNFLILVWLMKRFLYKPVLSAIDAREKGIAAQIADAAAKKTEALKEQDEFRRKNAEFDGQRGALLAKAVDEAAAERKRLLGEAQQAADALAAKGRESLEREAHALDQAVGMRLRQEAFAIARKALMDLAGSSLEERIAGVFIRRLQGMEGKAKDALGLALKEADGRPALLRSAFELPSEQRTAIQKALNEAFSADVHVRFEVAADLSGGIELSTSSQKLAWSVADYLGSMEKDVDALLQKNP